MSRKPSIPPFLTSEGLIEAVGKTCAKNDIAVDNKTVAAVTEAVIDTLFTRVSSEKRINGDHFDCKLFKMVVKDRPERLHRNPKLGKAVAKGATRVVVFKMGSDLHKKLEDRFRKSSSKKLKEAEAAKNGEAPPKEVEEAPKEVEEAPKKVLKKKLLKKKATSSSDE